jgi:UDP-N-acetylmuramoylalanine--D-glutamate ligase
VRTVHGVTFYNDSKATNLDAAVQAIRSFPGERIHLILGGKDKGGDWAALVPLLSEKVHSVLLVGTACGVIADALADRVPWIDCGTVSQAVGTAWSNAEKGDVVLLSPGCASFDQYAGFEDRGDDFIRAVEEIDHA